MLTNMASNFLLKLLLPLSLVFTLAVGVNARGLKVGFYKKTCPQAEAIILGEMKKAMLVAPSLAGPLLRLHFHDCFVNGCDASILLNATGRSPAEKDAPPNLSLRGFDMIDRVKAKLEKACPGIVSCADVLAVVARDAVYLSKGPFYDVLTGRRDSRRSVITDIIGNLPPPTFDFFNLTTMFASKGLTVKDLVALSGGHTIGTSHCSSFSNRLYDPSGKKAIVDPTLDSDYASKLRSKCRPNDTTTRVEMDPGSSKIIDTSYYKMVAKRRSLFNSDDALLANAQAKALVMRFASSTSEFFREFGVSMVKMGNIGIVTGTKGEIRKRCAIVN